MTLASSWVLGRKVFKDGHSMVLHGAVSRLDNLSSPWAFERIGVKLLPTWRSASLPLHVGIWCSACKSPDHNRRLGVEANGLISDTSMFGSLQALPSWLNTFGTRQPDGRMALTTYQKAIANSGMSKLLL